MANALGARYLQRWKEGTTTLYYLERVLALGWITQEEYDRAITDCPPVNPDDQNSTSTCALGDGLAATEAPAPA